MPMKTTLDSRPSGTSRDEPALRGDDLLDDLAGRQVAGQAALAGRAERAAHPAAGLAGDADRDPVGIAHQDRLDQHPVVPAPDRLHGVAAVADHLADRA